VRRVDIWSWMTYLVSTYGYAGAFVISIVGNFTVFLPVPFALTIYAFGATLNPLLLGLVCGAGSAIGELSAYLIGVGGRKVLDESYGRRLESAKQLVQRYGMTAIFLFALLPLPDDLVLIPLGMLRYSLRKAMLAMWAGKTIMCTVVAYAGRYSYSFVRDIFASGGLLGGAVSVVLLVVIVVVLIRVDWAKYLDPKKQGS